MDDKNLYRPPSAEVAVEGGIGQPLYSPGQVAAAAFLGSPIAGCWLLASNFGELGLPGPRRDTLIAGVVATAIVFVLALSLPEDFPNLVIPMAYTFGLLYIARQSQGEAFRKHMDAGGQRHSHWRVILIGVVSLIVFFVVSIAIVLVLPDSLLPF